MSSGNKFQDVEINYDPSAPPITPIADPEIQSNLNPASAPPSAPPGNPPEWSQYAPASAPPLDDTVAPQVDSPPPKPSVVGGAAAIGAVAGLVVLGPIAAVVGGAGMAAVAIADKGAVGKAARGGGKGVSKFNKENKITERTKAAATVVGQSISDFTERHRVQEKVQQGSKDAVRSAKEFNKKHQVLDKTAQVGKSTMKGIGNFVKAMNKKPAAETPSQNSQK